MNRSGMKVMRQLIGLVKPLTGYMCLAVTMGLFGHLCAAAISILCAYALVNGMKVSMVIIITLLLAILRAGLRYGEQTCNHFIAFKLLALIRSKVFGVLRTLAPAKLEGKDSGNLISLITSDIELLEVFYAHTISPICIAFLFDLILILFIGHYHILLGLLALVSYVVIGVIVPIGISKLNGDDGKRFRDKAGDLSTFVLDSVRGLREIRQYGQGNDRLSQMNQRSDALASDEEKLKKKTGINSALSNTAILVCDMAMLVTSGYLFQTGQIQIEGLVVSVVALMSSFGPSVALAALGSTLANTLAAGNRVLDVLEEKPQVKDIVGKNDIVFTGANAAHVHFAYDQEEIVKDFSLEIPEGKILGIVGKSGSGKSTFLKLLMRFFEVNQGKIEISGHNINEINTTSLRDNESYVTQETHLFHDSIRENIRIANLQASDAEIEEACKKAGIHDFIMTLPKGYDSEVGELGSTLSGGERQRLGVARAFLHKAPFVLLDEPTSNLDSLSEAVILKSLREAKENQTVILVSHRESTMCICDDVVRMESGRKS